MASRSPTRELLSREAIVRHTLTLIEIHGIAGFRLKDLADRLDVTVPNLYRHFKNRDDIVYSALTDDYIALCAATAERIDEITSRVSSTADLFAVLRHGGELPLSTSGNRRRTTRLQALAAFGSHERSDEIQAALHAVHVAIEKFFEKTQAEGFVEAHHSPRVLTLIASSILAGIAITEVDPYIESAEKDIWTVLGTFLQALAPSDLAAQ